MGKKIHHVIHGFYCLTSFLPAAEHKMVQSANYTVITDTHVCQFMSTEGVIVFIFEKPHKSVSKRMNETKIVIGLITMSG